MGQLPGDSCQLQSVNVHVHVDALYTVSVLMPQCHSNPDQWHLTSFWKHNGGLRKTTNVEVENNKDKFHKFTKVNEMCVCGCVLLFLHL